MNKHEAKSISVDAGTTVSGGEIHGNVRGGNVTMGPVSTGDSSASKDLLALLGQLKAEIAAAGLPEHDLTMGRLDDLIEQTQSTEPEPDAGKWTWKKITAALAGIKQFDDLVDRIARHLTALWPS